MLIASTLLLLLCSGNIASSQYRVIGYYAMWKRAILPPQAVKYPYVTHVLHAFSWPLANGAIASADPVVDSALINTTHRAGRKILISFGGASESGNFPAITADSLLRRAFIQNIVTLLQTYNYDGADLDWEGPQSLSERANETTFIRELRTAFLSANPQWLITMAVGVTDYSGQWHDFSSLKLYVDWFNAMCYDFHGSWSAHAGPNAPLYPAPTDVNDGSVDQGITYLKSTRGIPGSQITLGMPFYGKQFQAAAMYTPKTEPTTDIVYSDVLALLAQNWAYAWDSISQVPFLTSPRRNLVATFEDTASIARKCQYAKAKGLSGVMVWETSQDVVAAGQPLIDVVGREMMTPTSVSLPPDAIDAKGFVLEDNYPNPFNPTTRIDYTVGVISGQSSVVSDVRLVVYDVLGREVAVLVNEKKSPGRYSERFNASRLASGVYLYRLQAGGATMIKKAVLLK
jgi:chitinase